MIAVVIPTRNPQYVPPDYDKTPIVIVRDHNGEGFAKTCNRGLAELQSKNVRWALICNDDAHIAPDHLTQLLEHIDENTGVIAPTITADQKILCAGISVSSWGRVRLRRHVEATIPDALSGACFLIPSWVRFDDGYLHGFEDIALCSFLKNRGFHLRLVSDVYCEHRGGGTLAHHTMDWYDLSLYGQLRYFSKRRYAPLILLMALVQKNIGKEGRRGVWKGFLRWKHQRFFSMTSMASSTPSSIRVR